MDPRITELRRKICIACPESQACQHRTAAFFTEQSPCPLLRHPDYHESLHAITHPGEPVSGCCDSAQPGAF